MKHTYSAVWIAAMAMAFTMPAQALPISGTFSGILHGTDTYGYYGPAGTDLSGTAVSGSYSFDTADMTDSSFTNYNVFAVNNTHPNSVSLSVTIMGVTITNSSGGNGALVQYGIDATHVYNNLRAEPGTSDIQIYLISPGAFVQGQPFTTPFTLETNPSYPSYISIAPSGGGYHLDNFTFTQLSVDAPEPASLALFGLGIGALATLRRRRQGVTSP